MLAQGILTDKVFVGGLAQTTTTEMLRKYFGVYGIIIDCVLMKDKTTQRSRGFGFVQFTHPEAVEKVIANYSNHALDGRWIEVKKAVPEEQMAATPVEAGQVTRRSFSPHAGSRAVRDALLRGRGPAPSGGDDSKSSSSSRGRTKKKKQGKKRRKKASSGSSSSTTSSGSKSSKSRKRKKRRRTRSSSSSSSVQVTGAKQGTAEATQAASGSEGEAAKSEVEAAKSEALKRLLELKSVEPREARLKEWRALLRTWHPDKNPDRTEVATAVFQFLQKGKSILEAS